MKRLTLGTIAAITAVASSTSFAAIMLDTTTYNGHTYELWESAGIRWQDAQDAAVGQGGYLATLTDAAETDAVYGAFIGTGFFTANDGQPYQAWLGGYTTDENFTTTNPAAWAWVTGESWTAFDLANFAAGEPNGDSSGLSINRFGTPKWNDESGTVGGYIVEKGSVSVPDVSSSCLMLGSGLVIVGIFSRKFKL